MAVIEVKIPTVGESVQEAVLVQWFKKDGEVVEKDEPIFVIETDKVTLEVVAETGGILQIKTAEGETAAVGAVVALIETTAKKKVSEPGPRKEKTSAVHALAQDLAPENQNTGQPAPTPAGTGKIVAQPAAGAAKPLSLSPAVRRLTSEKKLDPVKITGSGPGGRITKSDVLLHLEQAPAGVPEECIPPPELSKEEGAQVRKAMTPIRKRIAARLLEAKQNTAMLTTFNDADMSRVMGLRSTYKAGFSEKYNIGLGFMSFFVKACVQALKEIPQINAFIDGGEIVYHNYQHIGVAIGSGKGLVAPVIRHAEKLSFAGIEKAIVDYLSKINENRLELADLEGGTFTISNGGIYGSLLSTPILNMPQSGILGMHRIEKRAVVVNDQITIRPMMYVALSYDHRVIDGREAVTFLKRIKEMVENPERLLLEV
ncbi:MAG: 2-oxoglutarate dehydrogenase complex dihydrolipoyllysine-residue succinyltransferase [Desulfobacteraceae bacterium]|nr:2-oxoglutarate dehydrogenase complex dihydrolipoyllysine-residue succinyltransferase [Desulfobacteraceae bacterium]